MVHSVAVIGAGPSGLTSIKACLEEGMDPTCFESGPDIGGLWRFKDEPEHGRANIYPSVVINSSKEMMAYSDFPPAAELPNNMHHSEVLMYLRLYAETFKLLQYIRFKTTVVSVKQRPDFPETGRWDVETESSEGQRITQAFDAVVVCSGHYTHPHLPLSDFPGIETFTGKYFHSWDYRSAEGLEGKKVVVIGIGNSGGDIAVDISRVAERVYLSTRSGAWVVGRVGKGGLPGDIITTSRLQEIIRKLFPTWTNKMLEKDLNQAFDHTLYGLKPKHSFWAQIPLVNDHLAAQVISGRIQVKPNVKEFRESSAIFVDGSVIDKVDVVVLATGYSYSFPFLPPEIQTKYKYRLLLYKHVFSPKLVHPTLAVVGFIHGVGSITRMAEMQVRWATRVFKGLIKLPSPEIMMNEIEKDTITMHQRFTCSDRNPVQVDVLTYMDSLAMEVGVKPNVPLLFLKDPKLALEVFMGPFTAYQYRLTGPGQWDGAREAILTQLQRVIQPFKTREIPEAEMSAFPPIKVIVVLSISAFLFGLYKKKLFS